MSTATENSIYSHIPKERLQDILETLHRYTALRVQLIDGRGEILHEYGRSSRYCQTLIGQLLDKDSCKRLHADAGRQAQRLGESYIFTCHAELNHIAFPLLAGGELLGTVIVGPFLMDTPDSTFISPLLEKYTVSPTLAISLYDKLNELPVLRPPKVGQLKKLLDHLFSPLLPAERMLLLQTQQSAYWQARTNEAIQIYKNEDTAADGRAYYEKVTVLTERVRAGDASGAQDALNKLIAHIYYAEGTKADTVRMHAQSLLAVLASAAVDGGAAPDLIFTLQKQYFARMQKETKAEPLCNHLREALESFQNEMLSASTGGNACIRNALCHMARYYYSPLTLESVAAVAGLSPNYFSHLFRETVGVTFREHLNRIRVEESKRLLLGTDYSLTDIAVAMGFTDQSYFCKVFKKITGVTPGTFRK